MAIGGEHCDRSSGWYDALHRQLPRDPRERQRMRLRGVREKQLAKVRELILAQQPVAVLSQPDRQQHPHT
jgi:hypothetical protein